MSEDDPEALLRSRIRDTSPDFERRWTDLKRTLRRPPPTPVGYQNYTWLKYIASAAGVALLLILTMTLHPPPSAQPPPHDYPTLLEFDAELRDGLPLADPEVREVVLQMPFLVPDPS